MSLPALAGWQTRLLHPLVDAALARTPDSPQLRRHALDFPDGLTRARVAAAAAEAAGFSVDEAWVERFLICAALDRQDNFARLLRRPLLRADRLEVHGYWPQKPFVALGLHWGAGFPALEHLSSQGHQPSFVYLPEEPAHLPSRPARLYDRLHLRALRGFGHSIRVGGAFERILTALEAGRVPVVLVDAPPSPGSRRVEVSHQGYQIQLRAGLPNLLAAQGVGFVFFRCWCPAGASRRRLYIGPDARSTDVTEIAEQSAAFLQDALALDSAQWHLWELAESLLAASAAPRAKQELQR